ncbi:rod-binding protein [Komagataeibacter kakiaceti JCM 25156]|uniref:rod-binding protein n=1 Tax=Komagataeibacter kakiaceti TaxID=943261 RepID=UPI00047193A6|nr:rod-binding protein [Komagataeibacter kakiaceti]
MSVGSITSSLASANQQASATQSSRDTALAEQAHKAAVDFEGVAITEFLQPMFDTVDTSSGPFGGGAAESQFRSLQIQEMGKQIAKNGGIGLADSVYRQILAMQEQAEEQARS